MNHRVMHLDNLYDFSLVRFEPESIVLLNKNTRKPFEFHQIAHLEDMHPELSHPYLLRPILYKNGLMYEKGCENLASMLEFRRRDYNPSRYSMEEIINTFEPIFECLEFVHKNGISYGNLNAEHITFFEDGSIFLKDWLFKRQQSESGNKINKSQDIKDLGLILAETATLVPRKQISKLSAAEIISMVLEFYPKNFAAAVTILIQGIQKHYPSALGLMKNQNIDCKVPEIKIILQQAQEIKILRDQEKAKQIQLQKIKEKSLKQVQNEKRMTPRKEKQDIKYQSVLNPNTAIQGSPTKKFNISTPNKKLIRLEDCENKKVFNQEVKKRQIEKITKIIERSNAFVNELMARKNNEKKFLNTVKVNATFYDPQENSKKTPVIIKESPKISSPTKRMRSISKKK